MLYTIDFEYRGGTYLAQVEAPGLVDVLNRWLQQTPDAELTRWQAERSAIAEAFARETPIAIQGLKGVWCVSCTINDSFALANIIATDERA
jgi:hypothetical protein